MRFRLQGKGLVRLGRQLSIRECKANWPFCFFPPHPNSNRIPQFCKVKSVSGLLLMLTKACSPRFLPALFVVLAVLSLPVTWVAAQSRLNLESQVASDHARIEDLSGRVESFSNLPSDVAVLKSEVATASKLIWYLISGAIAAAFGEIAHRIRAAQKRRETDNAILQHLQELKKG